ncbi:MAG: carbohydrate ABC transporter permease [Ruminococcaceae bacterium]|nr:carbohydrate ABC transporter permease [Oscillospiraceae bacterium]
MKSFIVKTPARRVFEVFNYVFLVCFALVCLMPVLHVIFASFSDPTLMAQHSGLIWKPLFDETHPLTLYGYKMVFGNDSLLMGYANTIFYCALGGAFSTILCTMGGFVLSRKGLVLKKYIMIFLTITMFFNGGMIPTYMVIKKIGLLNNRLVMIIPNAVNVMSLVIIRTAIQGMPTSLEESARLDGAGNFTILFKIVIPLVKATVAVLALQYVLMKWNAYFEAMIYLNDRKMYPLQVILREILVESDSSSLTYDAELAQYADLIEYCTIVVAILPVFCFYPFILKYFTKGMMIGSLKG